VLLQTGDTGFWSDPKSKSWQDVRIGTADLHTIGYYMHGGGQYFLKFMEMHLHSGD
jgi:hypothetical protein